MLFDLLTISGWKDLGIWSIQLCCITLEDTDSDRCLLGIAFVGDTWMVDVLWIHILTVGD